MWVNLKKQWLNLARQRSAGAVGHVTELSMFDIVRDSIAYQSASVPRAESSRVYPSKAEFMKEVIGPFNARMSSPLVPSMRGLYADEDMVIALFDGSGTARDGKSYRNTYSWYMRMSEGQIVEVTAFFDSVEFNEFWARVVPVA